MSLHARVFLHNWYGNIAKMLEPAPQNMAASGCFMRRTNREILISGTGCAVFAGSVAQLVGWPVRLIRRLHRALRCLPAELARHSPKQTQKPKQGVAGIICAV